MAMDKFKLMQATGNYDGVDSAVPEPWVDRLVQLGLDRHSIMMYYAYSYHNGNCGKPIHLGEELINLMAHTRVMVRNQKGEPVKQIDEDTRELVEGATMLQLIQTMLDHPDELEIRLR